MSPIFSENSLLPLSALEEMLTTTVPEGALFFGASHRRQDVAFDAALREATAAAARDLHDLVAVGRTPPPEEGPKCRHCSMLPLCMPRSAGGGRSARKYLQRELVKACLNVGQRVQNSVFECDLDPGQWVTLKHRLEELIDPAQDSLRYYYLGSNWQHRVEHVGAKQSRDLRNEPLIV